LNGIKKEQRDPKEIYSWFVLLLGLRTLTKRESPRKFQDPEEKPMKRKWPETLSVKVSKSLVSNRAKKKEG
jgi:hypothetical protein